jgi:hypothetical protein
MGEHVGSKPIGEGYVAMGWQELGDLRKHPNAKLKKPAACFRSIIPLEQIYVPDLPKA